MKLNPLHAAAIVLALTASANAMAVTYAAIGDYIDLGSSPTSLSKVTFSLSSTLASSAGNNLTLYIYDKTGDPLIGCMGIANPYGEVCSAGSGTASSWGSSFFDYSFSFSPLLQVSGEIVYILSYDGILTDPDELKIRLTTDDPTPIGKVLGSPAWGGEISIEEGQIYAEDATNYFSLGFVNPENLGKINLTPVVKFEDDNGGTIYESTANQAGLRCNLSYSSNLQCQRDVIVGTVPEPATLMLLGIGLAGLGYVRSRKAIG
jgi:hypothetical protein